MAFTIYVSGNTVYLQETATYAVGKSVFDSDVRIVKVIITSTDGSNPAQITLSRNNENRSYPNVITLQVKEGESSQVFDFSGDPLVFTDGIRIKSMQYADITLIVNRNKES